MQIIDVPACDIGDRFGSPHRFGGARVIALDLDRILKEGAGVVGRALGSVAPDLSEVGRRAVEAKAAEPEPSPFSFIARDGEPRIGVVSSVSEARVGRFLAMFEDKVGPLGAMRRDTVAELVLWHEIGHVLEPRDNQPRRDPFMMHLAERWSDGLGAVMALSATGDVETIASWGDMRDRLSAAAIAKGETRGLLYDIGDVARAAIALHREEGPVKDVAGGLARVSRLADMEFPDVGVFRRRWEETSRRQEEIGDNLMRVLNDKMAAVRTDLVAAKGASGADVTRQVLEQFEAGRMVRPPSSDGPGGPAAVAGYQEAMRIASERKRSTAAPARRRRGGDCR